MTTPTLGDIAMMMREWKAQGVTLAAVDYVLQQVWWEETDAKREAYRQNDERRWAEGFDAVGTWGDSRQEHERIRNSMNPHRKENL